MLLIITNVHLVNGSHLPCGPVAPANKHKVWVVNFNLWRHTD
jgi:hypothetical protein